MVKYILGFYLSDVNDYEKIKGLYKSNNQLKK